MQTLIEQNLLQPYKSAIDFYGKTAQDNIQKRVVLGLSLSLYSRMCDINKLIEDNSLDSAQVLMRVAFENQVYIIYLFKNSKKLEQRCNAYFYSSYQKYAYYLTNINRTSLGTQKSLIQDSIKTHSFSADNDKNTLASYLNFYRSKFRKSIPIPRQNEPKGLSYTKLSSTDNFEPCNIDHWKWYNENNKTPTFFSLVKSLKFLDPYAALYSPTSDIVHSDEIPNHLHVINNELVFSETMEPKMLVFFRASILKDIRRLRSITEDKNQITQYLNNAYQAYRSNYISKKD